MRLLAHGLGRHARSLHTNQSLLEPIYRTWKWLLYRYNTILPHRWYNQHANRYCHTAHSDSVCTAAKPWTQAASPADLYLHARRLVSVKCTTGKVDGSLTISSVCLASVLRIYYLQVLRTSTDVTYSMGNVFIWSSVEPAIGIVSSCLISIRPTIQKMLSAALGTISTQQSDRTKSHEQPSSIYDGRPQDEQISLVCAGSSSVQDHPASNERVVITKRVDVCVSESVTGNHLSAL